MILNRIRCTLASPLTNMMNSYTRRRFRTTLAFHWALPILVALTACKERLGVWPVYNFASNNVEFLFGTADGIEQVIPVEFVEVVTCNTDSTQAPTNNVVWRIESATKPNIVKVSHLSYGETPAGARVAVEAKPLELGCYWVRDNHARYRFQKYSGAMAGFGDRLGTDPIFKRK